MQNTFSLSTKGGETLPGRSLFLCEQQKHKLLFTSHLLPPPLGGFAAVHPKSMIFKKNNNKVFTAHFPAQLTYSSWLFGANKMPLRSAGVLHHPVIHLLKISMPRFSHRTQVWSCIFITISTGIYIFYFFFYKVFLIWFPDKLRGHGQATHPLPMDSCGFIGDSTPRQIKGVSSFESTLCTVFNFSLCTVFAAVTTQISPKWDE